MFCSSVAIAFCQYCEYFNAANDMFYHYPLPCQLPVSSLVFSSERLFFTAFLRYLTVAMQLLHSLITAVQLCLCLFIEWQLTFLKHFKVMRFTSIMSGADDMLCLLCYY